METSYERGTLVDPFENIFAEHIFGQRHLDDWRARQSREITCTLHKFCMGCGPGPFCAVHLFKTCLGKGSLFFAGSSSCGAGGGAKIAGGRNSAPTTGGSKLSACEVCRFLNASF